MYKYERIIFWSDEDSSFIVEVPELPGCMIILKMLSYILIIFSFKNEFLTKKQKFFTKNRLTLWPKTYNINV